MKAIFLTHGLFALMFNFSYSQSVEILNEKKIRLLKQVGLLQDSIKKIETEIEILSQESLLSNDKDSTIKVVTNEPMVIKTTPYFLSAIKTLTKKGDTLTVYNKVIKSEGYDDYYVKLVSGGFIDMRWLVQTDQLQELKKRLVDSIKRKEDLINSESAKALAEREKAQVKKKLAELTKRFGAANAKKISEGRIWIGMTSSMALESWGQPNEINRTVGGFGTHEQWIYKNSKTYLYFDNDKLTGWQD